MQSAKGSAIGWSVILAGCLAIILAVTTYMLAPIVPTEYLRYFQVGEVALVGFFAIHTISKISYRVTLAYSEQTAKSIRSLIRITGAIIVIAFGISYLSQDPIFRSINQYNLWDCNWFRRFKLDWKRYCRDISGNNTTI